MVDKKDAKKRRVNRFTRTKVINVSRLPISFFLMAVMNTALFLVFACVLFGVWRYWSTGEVSAAYSSLPTITSTATNTQTPTATNTQTPTATNTQTPTAINTQTPTATNTQTPTATPLITPTSVIFVLPTVASPTPVVYDYSYLASLPVGDAVRLTSVSSDFPVGFYRAECHDALGGQSRISMNLVSSYDLYQPGYMWKLDNFDSGYDYVDFADNEQGLLPTFYLSDESSIWSIQFFWHDEAISDRVSFSFPDDCRIVELVFAQSVSSSSVFEVAISE